MSQVCHARIVRILGLLALASLAIFTVACGSVSSSNLSKTPDQSDPLHLGGSPGPLGTTADPQILQVRLGSEPNDRIISLSLTLNSLKATNSGAVDEELLPAPVTLEFARSGIVSDPVSILSFYQDTYSALVFPTMSGTVVFYDSTGQPVTQAITVNAQSVPVSFVLGTDPLVLSVSLDLSQSFTINDPNMAQLRSHGRRPNAGGSYVTPNPLVLTLTPAAPNPVPAPNQYVQPEAGGIVFLTGTATSVDTNGQVITLQPSAGESMQLSYDLTGDTQFIDCDPTMLTGMMIEIEALTRTDGSVLATQISLMYNSASESSLYGTINGYAPEGLYYNLVVNGGQGVNVSSALMGANVTLNWSGDPTYSVNNNNLDLSGSQDLIFDETHVFPGQFVSAQWDSLEIPDPDSDTQAGAMEPGLFELNQQTLSGTVTNYTYDPESMTGTFTLTVSANSALRAMNPGLTSITVRQIPETNLRNNPTFNNGDTVKVRGLLFSDPNASNVNYQPSPSSPIAFIMVAGRISQ